MIAILAAPSNLGLRPPEPSSVPGCAKAPEALREAGLHRRLVSAGAEDAGVVVAPRYIGDVQPGRLRNQDAIVAYSRKLAGRIDELVGRRQVPLVLGGDCSLLTAAGVALAPRGRYALIHLDGHTDFRHPGNSNACASLAGEDLAAAVGLHWPTVADIDGLAPYFAPEAAVHIGCRDDDAALEEVRSLLGAVITATELVVDGVEVAAEAALTIASAGDLDGFWLHVDVDILDPEYMPAVDSPAPGGLTPQQLQELLAALAPLATGVQVTIFDPDLDPDGSYARLLADLLVKGLGSLGSPA